MMSAVDTILEDIRIMISQKKFIDRTYFPSYTTDEIRLVGNYRNYIVPQLRKLIQDFRNQELLLTKEKQASYLYECIIQQVHQGMSQQRKQKFLGCYSQNNSIVSHQMNQCLQNILTVLNDVKEAGIQLGKIRCYFSEIKMSHPKLAGNIKQMYLYFAKKLPQTRNSHNVDYIANIAILLSKINERVSNNTPIVDWEVYHKNIPAYFQEIRYNLVSIIDQLSKKGGEYTIEKQLLDYQLREIYQLLSIRQKQGSIIQSIRVIKKSIISLNEIKNHELQHFQSFQQFNSMAPLIQKIHYFIQQKEKSIDQFTQKDLLELNQKFKLKIVKLQEIKKQSEMNKQLQFIVDNFFEKKMMINPTNAQVQKYLYDLQRNYVEAGVKLSHQIFQRQNLSRILQQSYQKNYQLTKQNESNKQALDLLTNQIKAIKQQAQAKQNKINLYQQFDSTLNDENSLLKQTQRQARRRLSQFKHSLRKYKQFRNDIFTHILTLKNQIKDRFQFLTEEIVKKYQQQIDIARKQLCTEKARDIQRVEERRRAQKTKLSNENDQLLEQLSNLRAKYYNEIGAKLFAKSRLDMSTSYLDKSLMSVSEKGVGNSIYQNNIDNNEFCFEEASKEQLQELEIEFKKQFKQDIQKLKNQNNALNQQIAKRNSIQQKLKYEIEAKTNSNKELELKLINQQKIIQYNSIQLKKMSQDIKKLLQSKQHLQSALRQYNQIKNQKALASKINPILIPFHKILLQGTIFQESNLQKQILIKHISTYMNSQIIKTNLLHRHDPNNKANFHVYIDHKKALLCVVKTQKVIIAGFYPGELRDGPILNQGGLLVSVTKNRSYRLLENKDKAVKINYRGMTYDPYYAIFGNAELRVRSGEKKVFSNFGIQSSYFNYENTNRNVDEFLLDGDNRQVEYQYCQFYQIFFHGCSEKEGNVFKTY